MQTQYELSYIASQWWKYFDLDDGRVRYCQTDGIILDDARRLATIVEIKYSHTTDAFWQLENLYVPVIRRYLHRSDWQLATVEVVKWYDPSIRCPRPVTMIASLAEAKPGNFCVHIMSPSSN